MIDAPDVERRLVEDRPGLVLSAPAALHTPVLLHSLSGEHVLLPLRKRPEFVGQDVLEVHSAVRVACPPCTLLPAQYVCNAGPITLART